MNLANKLTILRIAMIPVFMIFALADMPYGRLVAAAVFVLASVTDAMDGYIARKRKEITNLGKLMDPLADKLLVAAALVALVQAGLISSWFAVIIIGREFLVTGLRGIAAAEGIVIAASNLAKLKTIIQIVALSMLLLDEYFLALAGFSPGIWALYLAVIFTVYTGYDYVVKTFAQIKMS
ncbi:MAG: CDP-diacylglycerol--glycerol-3-phosphate 3-phosphatidyltransferase [Clostridiales bacterium]|nr:CDP-diacylglycerol--glycerol-3-phosphate 3-phosphatidyltransferase [Clostridiales bacterium]